MTFNILFSQKDTCINIALWERVEQSVSNVIDYNKILNDKINNYSYLNSNYRSQIKLQESIIEYNKGIRKLSESHIKKLERNNIKLSNKLNRVKKRDKWYLVAGVVLTTLLIIK